MYIQSYEVDIVTSDLGVGVGYTPVINGRILLIRYVKPTTGGFATGVDFDLELESSGVVVWDENDVNSSKTVLPRQAVQSTSGVDEVTITEPIYCGNERLKISVADGGDTANGKFYIMAG